MSNIVRELEAWADNSPDEQARAVFKRAADEVKRLQAENIDLQRKAGVERFSGTAEEFQQWQADRAAKKS